MNKSMVSPSLEDNFTMSFAMKQAIDHLNNAKCWVGISNMPDSDVSEESLQKAILSLTRAEKYIDQLLNDTWVNYEDHQKGYNRTLEAAGNFVNQQILKILEGINEK